MTFVTMWRYRFFSRYAPHTQTLKMPLIAVVIGWKVRPAPPDPNKEKPAVHKRINRGKYTHFERCSVCSRRSKYLSLTPISNNSQSNHRIIALCCYLQHISLRICLHTHADTHTHAQCRNSERLSVEFCFWNKLQFIRILNIPWRHLKSTSQIQGAYYTTLLSNHTSHRDFHS